MNQPEEQSSWQNLWEELGLPAEPPAARPEEPVAPAEQPSERTEAVAAEATGDLVEEVAPAIQPAAEAPPARADEEREEGRGRRRRGGRGGRRGRGEELAAEEAPVPLGSQSPPEAEPAPTEEGPDSAAATPPAEAEAAEADEREPRGRRRRSRSRGRKRPAEAAAPSEAPAEPVEEAPDDVEDGDVLLDKPEVAPAEEEEELEDLSNLNVPSWNELIASLYRPDR
jgi:ribonuclease E